MRHTYLPSENGKRVYVRRRELKDLEETYKKGKKQDFIKLLDNKLPDTMDEKQKSVKVRNLLQIMHKEGTITLDSSNHRRANWRLTKDNNLDNPRQ